MDLWKDRIYPLVVKKRNEGISDLSMEKEMNLPSHAINKWSNGVTASWKSYIPQLAKYLGVSIEYLMGASDDPTPQGVDARDDLTDVQKSLIASVRQMTDAEAAAMYALAKTLEAGRKGRDES